MHKHKATISERVKGQDAGNAVAENLTEVMLFVLNTKCKSQVFVLCVQGTNCRILSQC